MNRFSEKIRNIEAKINNLKTLGLSSSSSLEVAEYTFSVNWKIIATTIGAGGEIFDVGASQYAYIRIRTKNNQPAFICLRYLSPIPFGEREIFNGKTLEKLGNSYNYGYQLYVNGDESDRQAIERGQSLPFQQYTFKIVSTAEITNINIIYEDHPIYDGRQP